MAVNHRKDSIQLIRDTEGINNKDRVRILSPGSSPPEETTEVTEHALYMEPKNTPGDGEPYEYEFACCTGRRFIPQRAGDANKLEGKTSAEVKAMFADGRAVFAGSGTSVSLDAEGDRVHSITVNGFTKQTGSGTPSPENQMPITTGGMRLVEQTLDGSSDEAWKESSTDEEIQFISFPDVFGVSYDTKKVCYTSYLDLITSGSDGGNWDLSTPGFKYFARKNDTILKINIGAKNVEEARQKLNKRPITIWREVADESQATGMYIPVIGTGGEYSAKCIKITDKLCAGDKFISRTLSGRDRKFVFDGSEDEDWYLSLNPVSGYVKAYIKTTGNVKDSAISDRCYAGSYDSDWLGNAKAEYVTVSSEGYICVSLKTDNGHTVDNLRSILSENPLPVWCCSTNYIAKNDKEVAMETHVRWVETLSQDDGWVQSSPSYGAPGTNQFYRKANHPAKQGGDTVCSCYKGVPENAGASDKVAGTIIASTTGNLNVYVDGSESLESFKSTLAGMSQAAIVYELATPVVYAHEPVDFEFSPGEDGAFTITGEADGTLDVYYKALQDGGDADKLGGKLPEYYAAAANALGQYTHTKSGTVHELTGTGDNIRFVATADFAAGDTVKVNGTTCTASTMSGDALWAGFFKSGAVVVCYRTGNALNFSGGGLAAAEAAKITPENLKTGVSVTVNGKTVAGTFTADGTAAAGDMLSGKVAYVKGQKVTGTIPSKAAASYKPGTAAQTIKAVQYLSGDQTIEGDAALIAANIKYGASIFDVAGSFTEDANAAAAEILTGKIGYVKGQKITGSMPNRGAVSQWLGINGTYTIPAGYHNGQGVVKQSITTKGEATYTPSTSEQVIEKNQYLTGSQFIKGDGNLVAGNIRSGVSIFGVGGSFNGFSGQFLVFGGTTITNGSYEDGCAYICPSNYTDGAHTSFKNTADVTFNLKAAVTGRLFMYSLSGSWQYATFSCGGTQVGIGQTSGVGTFSGQLRIQAKPNGSTYRAVLLFGIMI